MVKVEHLFLILIVIFGDTVNGQQGQGLGQGQKYPQYTCEEQGMFPHPESSDCGAFVLCDSKLNATTEICPTGTYFWPSENMCASYYNCLTDSSPDGTNPCKGFTYYDILNKFSTDCTSYISCEQWSVGNSAGYSEYYNVVIGTVSNCPSGTIFDQYRLQCVGNSKCVHYECVEEGYFPNPDTSDCSSFISCDKFIPNNSNESFLYPTVVTCPQNTLFSPFSKKCDSFHTCGGKDLWKGIYPCSTYNWNSPVVPNPRDTKCTTYLSCRYSFPDRTIGVIEKKVCPTRSFFSPNLGKCYRNYDCNETCSKDPCGNGIGKFADYKSGYCEGFIECRDDSTEANIYQPTYERRYCPPGMNFSPKIGQCDRDYVCPKIPANYCYPTATTTAAPIPPPVPAQPVPQRG